MPALVTILIPHYKTLQLTKLCLRLIRKHTNTARIQAIVIDNGSQDASTDYLRTLKWITLLERNPEPQEAPALSHGRALDLGLKHVTTPYVLSIHTDTLVKNAQWLDFLLAPIANNPAIAGVGAWKLERRPLSKKILKTIERFFHLIWHYLGQAKKAPEGKGANHYYLRSYCALYRTETISKAHLTFSEGYSERGEQVGKVLHRKLQEAGYTMLFLNPKELRQYIDHVEHATMVLNPEFKLRDRTFQRGKHQLEKSFKEFDAENVLADDRLDT